MWYDEATDISQYFEGLELAGVRYNDAPEIQAIAHAFDREMNAFKAKAKRSFENRSFGEMDLAGVVRWEKILQITSPLNSTLQARKDAIKSKLMTKPPITLKTLKQIIETYMGLEVEISVANSVIEVKYRGESKIADLSPMYATIYYTIPANLLLQLSYAWATWGEAAATYSTWESMRPKTWDDIRKGV